MFNRMGNCFYLRKQSRINSDHCLLELSLIVERHLEYLYYFAWPLQFRQLYYPFSYSPALVYIFISFRKHNHYLSNRTLTFGSKRPHVCVAKHHTTHITYFACIPKVEKLMLINHNWVKKLFNFYAVSVIPFHLTFFQSNPQRIGIRMCVKYDIFFVCCRWTVCDRESKNWLKNYVTVEKSECANRAKMLLFNFEIAHICFKIKCMPRKICVCIIKYLCRTWSNQKRFM